MATIYKQGSKGEQVKLLQRLLGAHGYAVTDDGDFGRKTEAAVKAFQQERGLTADGIAGRQTLAKLCGVDITLAPISVHITRYGGRPITYIVLHYTAGSTSKAGAAMVTRNVFLQRDASADFVVDDATIVQVNPNPANYYCWAVGDKKNPYTGGGRLYGIATNRNTINIEVCSNLQSGTSAAVPNHEGWSFSSRSLNTAVRLVRYLMLMYDIPRDRVVRHYDITGKLCPGIIGWNNATVYTPNGEFTKEKSTGIRWVEFIALL